MHVKYEGKEYTFDLEEITVAQARTMKSSCGLTLMGLEDGLTKGDPDALRAVFWLMLCQNGEPAADIDRIDFKIVKFARAIDEAAGTEADPKAESTESSPV
jgi:hypothetical protein